MSELTKFSKRLRKEVSIRKIEKHLDEAVDFGKTFVKAKGFSELDNGLIESFTKDAFGKIKELENDIDLTKARKGLNYLNFIYGFMRENNLGLSFPAFLEYGQMLVMFLFFEYYKKKYESNDFLKLFEPFLGRMPTKREEPIVPEHKKEEVLKERPS